MKIKNMAFLAVVAVALAGAFAFKPRPMLAHFYGVSAENSTTFTIAEEIDGETENVHYRCQINSDRACTITSDAVYTPGQVVTKGAGVVKVIDDKQFEDLAPGQ
jgi:predicted hotdog family 3-hydroxylacyl-ACP dehydratase